MQLKAPCKPIFFQARDIYDQPFDLRNLLGRKVLLAFFRDAACPFCNLRLYELTREYQSLRNEGMEVIAVFTSPSSEVRRFEARHPRPFIMLGDPELELYQRYGIQHSGMAIIRAMLFKPWRILQGILKGGHGDRKNPHMKVVPADFLINEQGLVELAWYGRDTSDHIPMKVIKKFAGKSSLEAALG